MHLSFMLSDKSDHGACKRFHIDNIRFRIDFQFTSRIQNALYVQCTAKFIFIWPKKKAKEKYMKQFIIPAISVNLHIDAKQWQIQG